MADREFRTALPNDPAGTVARYGLRADPEEVRFLWDDAFHRDMLGRADWMAPEAVQQYRAWIGEKLLYRELARAARAHLGALRSRCRTARAIDGNRRRPRQSAGSAGGAGGVAG